VKWLKINTVLLVAVLSFWMPVSQADTQFRVIVDASGSMLISDPDKLTSEALRLISNLAPEEQATLGIWLFGEEPRVLLPESTVNKATKAKLASYVNSYVTQDVKTDLEAIIKLLLKTPDSGNLASGFSRHWILVTDGMVDISLEDSVNKASRDRILNQLTSELEDRGIHLHTVSMTGYTDKALLESLSLRTNATHTEVAIPEDLLDTFDRIFSQASPSDELPFDGDHFLVDDAIDELTLVVFHDGGRQPRITKPDGSALALVNSNSVSVSAAEHYTLFTVRRPAAGNWTVSNVDLERSSVRVMTDLGIQASTIPPIVFQGEVTASSVGVFQENALIQDLDVLGLLNVEQTLVRLSGEQKETVFIHNMALKDDTFVQTIGAISEPGNYELISLVDGKTFSRQMSQFFTVNPAIEFSGTNPSGNLIAFSAKPVNLRLDVLSSHIMLEFTYNNGTTKMEEMPLVGQGYWEKIIPVETSDTVKVRAQLSGVTQTGSEFEYWTPFWHFNKQADNSLEVGLGQVSSVGAVLLSAPILEKDAMPVMVPPAISIVTDAQEQIETQSEGLKPDQESSPVTENTGNLSEQEWILYALLNVGGIIAIAGGIFLYRRLKHKSTDRDDINDV
jgi:uncharacterized protein (TIGR03503 family)